jgi:putative peptide zinc metalloprotease protein
MARGPLQFRRDLVVSQHDTRTGTCFVIKDPATGRFFRFKAPEYFLAQQLDGITPLADIRRRVEERFGAALPQETVVQFLETLRRLGLLEAERAARGHPPPHRRRMRGTLLSLRLQVCDPDCLFARLVWKVQCCFTPYFLGGSAVLILLACLIAIANWGELGRDLLRLSHVQALLLAWLTLLPISTAHEFAHGVTCKHFGGAVHEVGFLLLYLQPGFYCNVSDAWLFPVQAHRLWVTFAGAYCELCLWALATLTWRVTEPETTVNAAAAVVMATSAIRSLFNLNPLIKLDGYYLLSDYLGIPNLRQRAFRHLGATLKRWWEAARQGSTVVSLRERRIYVVYGLLAGTYSVLLLGFIAVQLGSFLIGRYQGVGVLLCTGLFMVVLRQPIKKALPRPAALFRPGQRLRIPRPVQLLLGLAVLLAVLCLGQLERKVTGAFTVLPVHNAEVRAQVEGTIAALHAEEGDAVNAGDLLARLADREARAELRKVEAEIAQQRAQLKLLHAGPRREEIALARQVVETAKTRQAHAQKRYVEATHMHTERRARAEATVKKAQERLKYAQSTLDMFTALRNQESVSRKELAEAEEQRAVRAKELEEAQAELRLVVVEDLAEVRREVAMAQKVWDEAQGRLQVVLAGSRSEEIEATEAAIARFEAQRRYLEEQLALVQVVSPIAGVITTPKLHEKLGQYVRKGDLIAQVHTLKTVTVEIPIAEKEVADVQRGQRIVLKARAYPWQTFYGEVTAIAPVATRDDTGHSGRTVAVSTQLDNTALLLKPAMTGHAKILCGKRRIIMLLAQWFARTMRVEFWSWW